MEIMDRFDLGMEGQGDGTCRGALLRHAIEAAVAVVLGLEAESLERPTRGPARSAFGRQVAMYLTHVVCGVPFTHVGRLFGRDRTTVAHACGVIEDRRDDPSFDAQLGHLEESVGALLAALSERRGWR